MLRPNHSSTPNSAENRSVQIVYQGTPVQPMRSTDSADYPATPGAYQASNAGAADGFVTKLSTTDEDGDANR